MIKSLLGSARTHTPTHILRFVLALFLLSVGGCAYVGGGEQSTNSFPLAWPHPLHFISRPAHKHGHHLLPHVTHPESLLRIRIFAYFRIIWTIFQLCNAFCSVIYIYIYRNIFHFKMRWRGKKTTMSLKRSSTQNSTATFYEVFHVGIIWTVGLAFGLHHVTAQKKTCSCSRWELHARDKCARCKHWGVLFWLCHKS